MSSKRSFRSTTEPVLYIKIQPVGKKGNESISELMSEEYVEEAEAASLTDEDISSHYSLPPQQDRLNRSEGAANNGQHAVISEPKSGEGVFLQEHIKGSSSSASSVDLSLETDISTNSQFSAKIHQDSFLEACEKGNDGVIISRDDSQCNSKEVTDDVLLASDDVSFQKIETDCEDSNLAMKVDNCGKSLENEHCIYTAEEEIHSSENESILSFPRDALKDEMKDDTPNNGNSLKHVDFVQASPDSVGTYGINSSNQPKVVKNYRLDESKRVAIKDTKTTILNNKVHKLETRIKMLEGELRETAAMEAALYSVIAEHGSSLSKLHAPARRLSRLYLHACNESCSRKASAARTSISGLVLVAKACANDVPRLMFWLSNSVILRTIISQAISNTSDGKHIEQNGGGKGNKKRPSSLKWKESSSNRKERKIHATGDFLDWEDPHTFLRALEKVEAWIFSRAVESIWWQTLTPHMQYSAAREASSSISSSSKKTARRASSSVDQHRGNLSLDLWKNAFKDACQRLCPVRAAGHVCGCLPVLARLVMEQCVCRLDLAMFNAILRESADEIPTDPISDPISDLKVLPIPAGRSTFGAGALLKNVIGNWSKWLAELFDIDNVDSLRDNNSEDYNYNQSDASFKSFNLLNALSDLLMLPKDLLLSSSIRKEVCPIFGTSLIKRILDNFVPDEFCPDPIPKVVLEALESEVLIEASDNYVDIIPCVAPSPLYTPPSPASFAAIIGEPNQPKLRSGSSLLRKSYTSDDELDELNSPLTSILSNGSQLFSTPIELNWISSKGNQYGTRYQLLREVWMNSE